MTTWAGAAFGIDERTGQALADRAARQAEDEARAASFREQRDRRAAARATLTRELGALTEPTVAAIVALHSHDGHGYCDGCDGGPDDSGDWPCRTVHTIADLNGILIDDEIRSCWYPARVIEAEA